VLQKAVERIRAQADTIDKADWRKSFLVCIPEHRRIFELACELGLIDCHELGN